MPTFRAVCETCNDLNSPRPTKAEAWQDAQNHVQTAGNNDHIVNVITTQDNGQISVEAFIPG